MASGSKQRVLTYNGELSNIRFEFTALKQAYFISNEKRIREDITPASLTKLEQVFYIHCTWFDFHIPTCPMVSTS